MTGQGLTSSLARTFAPALLVLAGSGAAAHPHGTLDCAVLAVVSEGRLHTLQLGLTLDAASSGQLQARVQAPVQGQTAAAAPRDPRAQAPGLPREVLAFRSLLAGLFRQSGWMLQARAAVPGGRADPRAGSDHPDPWRADWSDPHPPQWQLQADGRLQVQVSLQPAGGPLPVGGAAPLELRCQDNSWYWLARYREPAHVMVQASPAAALAAPDRSSPDSSAAGSPCRVALDDWQSAADRARAQQAQARQAGAAGADQMAPGLADDNSSGAALVRLHC